MADMSSPSCLLKYGGILILYRDPKKVKFFLIGKVKEIINLEYLIKSFLLDRFWVLLVSAFDFRLL